MKKNRKGELSMGLALVLLVLMGTVYVVTDIELGSSSATELMEKKELTTFNGELVYDNGSYFYNEDPVTVIIVE